MKNYHLSAAIVACLLAGNTWAGGAAPFYVGGSIGTSMNDNDAEQMDNHGVCVKAHQASHTCDINDGGTTGHIYGGFQFSESLAVEGGFVSLGNSADYEYSDPINISQKTTGFTVAGVARQRISQTSPISVYGKGGVMRWSSTAETKSTNPAVANTKVTQTGFSPIIGAGVEYEMTDNMTLKAGWDRYYGVGKKDTLLEFNNAGTAAELNTLKTDVDVISAGINYHFY